MYVLLKYPRIFRLSACEKQQVYFENRKRNIYAKTQNRNCVMDLHLKEFGKL